MLTKHLSMYLVVNVLVTYLAMPLCNNTRINVALRLIWIACNLYHLAWLQGLDKYVSAKILRYVVIFCIGSDMVDLLLRYYRDSHFAIYCKHNFYHFQHATIMVFPLFMSFLSLIYLKVESMRLVRLNRDKQQ